MAAHRWIFILLLCHLLVLLIINLAVAAPVDNGSHEMTHSGDGEIEESKAESDKHDVINNENVSLDVEDVEDDPDEDAVSKDKEEIKETSSKSQELEHEEDDEEEGKPEEETVNNESSSKKENAEEVESAKSSEVVVTEDSEERKKEDLSTENDLGDLEKGSQEVLPKEAEESTESVHNNGNEETILDNKHHMLPEEHGSTTNLGSDQSGHIIQDSSEKLGDAEKSKEIEETMEETDAPDSEIFKHIDDDQARSMPLSGSLLGISEEENVEDEDGTGIDHENESNDDNHEDNGNEDTVGTAEVKSAIEKSEENEPVPVEASTGDSVGSMEHPLEKNKMDVTHEEEDDGDADSSNAEHKTSETHNSAEVETVASEEKSEAESAILPIKNEGDNGASHEKNEEETDGTHEENEAAVPHESNEDETRTTHENNEDDDVAEGHENSEDDVSHENENETEDAHEKNEDGTDVTDSGKVDTGTSNVVDNKDETHVADVENETDAAANDEYYDDDDDDDANDDKDGTDVVAGRADGDSTENKDDTDVAKDEENETDVADDHEDETGVADDNEDETEHVNSEHETDVTHEAIEDETAAVHENNEDDTPVSNENNEDHVSHENDEHGSAVTSANIEGDNARSHGSNEDEEAVSHEDHEKVTVVPFGLAFDGSEHDDHEEEDAASNKTDNDEVGENDKADDEDNGDKADENDEADDYDDDDDDDHDALPFVASFNEDKGDSDSHEEKEEKLNEIGDDEDGAVAPEEHTSATVDGDEKVGDSHEKNTDTNPNSEDTEVDEKPASGETDVHIIPSLNNSDAVNSNETDDYDYEAKTETSPSHESNGSDAAMFHIGAASHDNTEPNETEEEEEDAHSSHVNQIEDDHNENADVKNDDEIADNHSIVTSTETAASQEVTEERKTVYVEAVGIEDAEDGDASGGNSTWKEDENEEEYEDKSDYDYNSKEDDLILGGLSEETAVHTESSIVDEGSGHIDDSLKPNEENETHIVREPIVPRVRFQHPLLAVPPHNEESKEVSPSSTGTDDFVATTQMSDVDEEHPDIATEKVIESEDDIQATNVPDGHGLGAPSTIDSDSVVSSSNAENDSIFATPAVMKENIRVKGSESGDSDGSVNEPGVGSQSENPDSDSQSSMGSYIVLGCIMGVIVVLLVYSVVRSRRRNQREKQEEDFGTEMKDVEKSLIPANQYNGGIHPDPHPEDESKTKLLHDPENKDDNEECDDESEKVDSKTTENGVQDHRDTFKHQQSYDAIESQLEPLNASNNTFNPQPKEPISPQPDVQRGHDKIVPQSARDRFFNVKPHHQNDSEHMNGFNDISEVVIEKPPTGSSPATNGYVNGNSDGLVAVHSGSQEQLSNPSSPSSKVKVRETVVEGSIPKKPLYVNRDQNGVSY